MQLHCSGLSIVDIKEQMLQTASVERDSWLKAVKYCCEIRMRQFKIRSGLMRSMDV